MIVVRQGRVIKVDSRKLVRSAESDRGRVTKSLAGYVAWHPNGRLAAFVAGDMIQFFHAVGENRDVFDRESDLALYHADSNTVTTTPQISQPDRVETFPTWSPDGRYLYFCSTDPLPVDRHREVRYDLMRISYDADSQRWGDVEPVLLAKDTGLSIAEPRISPDGRWLLFCMSDYGEFPVFQPSSDLYLMDLSNAALHPAGHQQPAQRVVAQLVQQQPLDRVCQQTPRRDLRPAVLQLRRRAGPRPQTRAAAAERPHVLRPFPEDVQRPGVDPHARSGHGASARGGHLRTRPRREPAPG